MKAIKNWFSAKSTDRPVKKVPIFCIGYVPQTCSQILMLRDMLSRAYVNANAGISVERNGSVSLLRLPVLFSILFILLIKNFLPPFR